MAEQMITDTDVLREIAAFCAQHEVKETTFGRLAIGDANLIGNLRAGRSLTLRTASRVMQFMREYRAAA